MYEMAVPSNLPAWRVTLMNKSYIKVLRNSVIIKHRRKKLNSIYEYFCRDYEWRDKIPSDIYEK